MFYHFLANVSDEINSFRAGCELCLRLQLEPDQTDNLNFVTICILVVFWIMF